MTACQPSKGWTTEPLQKSLNLGRTLKPIVSELRPAFYCRSTPSQDWVSHVTATPLALEDHQPATTFGYIIVAVPIRSIQMSHTHGFAANFEGQSEVLSSIEQDRLETAVLKLILMGAEVGVSPDQMISLLNSGLTVPELLDYLTAAQQKASA